MQVSLEGAWKGTETGTEFSAIVPGLHLPLISGRIKHTVKYLITDADFFILEKKGQRIEHKTESGTRRKKTSQRST